MHQIVCRWVQGFCIRPRHPVIGFEEQFSASNRLSNFRRTASQVTRKRHFTTHARHDRVDWSVYLVTDRKLCQERPIETIVKEALEGGCSVLQYRDKDTSTRDMIEMAKRLKLLARQYEVPLIINDRVDVALAVEADGVHVGQDDMPPDIARKLIGKKMLLGVSVGSLQEGLDAQKCGADYVGAGPIFSTSTKSDAGPATGLSLISDLAAELDIPVIAIGGLNKSRVQSVIEAGAAGVAIVSAIIGADDPRSAALSIAEEVDAVTMRETQRILEKLEKMG